MALAPSGRRSLDRQESRTLSIKRQPSDENITIGWPKEYGNKKVFESDGAFFESFTALAWKQENRRRRAASEDEKRLENELPTPETPHGPRPKAHQLGQNEFELLYIEVLYTIKHKIGTTSGGHLPFIQDLYLYARDAFGVTPEDHARLLARASEEKSPIVILNVTVIEAKNLEAKDADGFSDPYCMLGIMPGSRLARERLPTDPGSYSSDEEAKPRRESALKRFSQSFKKGGKKDKTARDMLPARFIKSTNVKPNTLNPVWNERFRFDLDDVNTDHVHLDIWDHDDESSVVDAAKRLNEVQGLKGLSRYFKQIAQSARSNSKTNVDDFLGSVNISLQDIPSTGLDTWFDLEGRSARSNVEGQIRLKLSLATREDRGVSEEEKWTEIRQHEDLMSIFIEHEARMFQEEGHKWEGELPQAALTILHQHAIQGDITDMQQSVCRWIAYSNRHMKHPLSWDFLFKLLDDLDAKWSPEALSREEIENLTDSFKRFGGYCLDLIRQQRQLYPCNNKTSLVRLRCMLRCLLKMYQNKVFYHCCPFHQELSFEAVKAIKKGSQEWYDKLHSQALHQSTSEEEMLGSMTDLVNKLNTDLQRSHFHYLPIYDSEIDVNYFHHVYKQLEKMLVPDVVSFLEEELEDSLEVNLKDVSLTIPVIDEKDANSVTAQETGMHMFELYLAINEFCQFRKYLPASDRKNMAITKYHEWFKQPIQRWLAIAKHKTMRRIRKSVEMDQDAVQAEQADSEIKQSTSAIDVACCFGQVVEFWKKMDWPEHPDAFPFVMKITEDVCQGASFYADLIHEKLKAAGYYDEIGQFDVTEELCRTINDIELVRRALRPLPDALKYKQVAKAIETASGEATAQQAYSSLYATLKGADESMVKKIKQVVDRVADKMRPDIKKDVFHLCWSPEKVPADEAIGDLMNYLDSNLVTLNTHLLRANFDRILDSIWVEVLEEISEVLNTEDVKASWFFERLYESLDILVDFFHADGKGLSMASIQNSEFEGLHRQLRLNKADTIELIDIYYLEKLAEQAKYTEKAFGTLSVRVYYNTDAEILSVEVLNAKNIIPLDPNGLSDPFVLIEICPPHLFPKQTIQQTQIVKNSLNPIFDEPFEFSVSVKQCKKQSACIHFTVMDHDFMLSNDFAGEGFLSLNNIPGIGGEGISGFSALKPTTMALTQPKKGKQTRAKSALAALEFRDNDKIAMEFVKKRKQVQAQSQT